MWAEEMCQEAGEAAASWDSSVRLSESGLQNRSLVASDHLLLNRGQDGKYMSCLVKSAW